jgi:hypothetical protein
MVCRALKGKLETRIGANARVFGFPRSDSVFARYVSHNKKMSEFDEAWRRARPFCKAGATFQTDKVFLGVLIFAITIVIDISNI